MALKGICDKIRKLGLEFGIWVEPEMVNENSDLYRAHPDWAMRIPGKSHSEGRNQMILDLARGSSGLYDKGDVRCILICGYLIC